MLGIGQATKRILVREFEQYEESGYERLSTVSVAHIYKLRKRRRYRECQVSYTKTRAVQVSSGGNRDDDDSPSQPKHEPETQRKEPSVSISQCFTLSGPSLD